METVAIENSETYDLEKLEQAVRNGLKAIEFNLSVSGYP